MATMLINNQPLVSILTPVYNMEKYLGECIESVLSQTYPCWEYIILNNRSTDESQKIAESYARNDSRIHLINNNIHLKQMENCNRAFKYISSDSKYCKVIHADDWLFCQCLSKMVEVAETYPTVGIVGSYRLDETDVNLDGLPYPSPCTSGRAIGRRYFLGGRYIFGSPSSLLIRSDLIRKREKVYDESTLHGDKLACLDILREADFGFVHQVLTFTRRHNESATSFIKKYKTYRLGTLQALLAYGSFYLSSEEYVKCLQLRYFKYYRFLAKSVINYQGSDFLRFHKNALNDLGHKFSFFKLFGAVLWELLNLRNSASMFISGFREKSKMKS